ncbi:hypothetical protein SAMN04488552_0858 [Christiangramia echinicola]|uniref:DUF2383 domain-containing protein n=1 Tax=Christiangramia echinicola TaxID=279359 RepID=A0A1H1LL68_9FLAO|nr:hypothetical protein SAMN04488552_0858 [Christiangramia echinicola]
MQFGQKKKTIELLEKLRIRNYKSAFMYKIAYTNENRLILKNFYRQLYAQKITFIEEIEERIELLKKEISPIPDPKMLSFYNRKKCELSQLYLKYKMKNRFSDFHRRELKCLKQYTKYLSVINHASVRELLLAHKHKIKSNIVEMNNTGVMKFPIA